MLVENPLESFNFNNPMSGSAIDSSLLQQSMLSKATSGDDGSNKKANAGLSIMLKLQ